MLLHTPCHSCSCYSTSKTACNAQKLKLQMHEAVKLLCRVIFKSWCVNNLHHHIYSVMYFHGILGVFGVLKQKAVVETLSFVSVFFPNVCFLFKLSVLPYFSALSGPHCEIELPKGTWNEKRLVLWITVVRQQCSVVFCFYITRDVWMYAHFYSIFFLSGKNSCQLYAERKTAKEAERWFSGFKRCFRHCGL